MYDQFCHIHIALRTALNYFLFPPPPLRHLAFPQKCSHKSESYQCTFGITCWMSGQRPLDLCNGGIFWSCCVPFETATNVTTIAVPEEISDPG